MVIMHGSLPHFRCNYRVRRTKADRSSRAHTRGCPACRLSDGKSADQCICNLSYLTDVSFAKEPRDCKHDLLRDNYSHSRTRPMARRVSIVN